MEDTSTLHDGRANGRKSLALASTHMVVSVAEYINNRRHSDSTCETTDTSKRARDAGDRHAEVGHNILK